MLYRRGAVAGLCFDEDLPTFGAEDANFSMQVGKRWRLVLCGDLHIKHHRTTTSRVDGPTQVYESTYGVARNHLSHSATFADMMWLLWFASTELVLDTLSFVSGPSWVKLRVIITRQQGLIDGARSIFAKPQGPEPQSKPADPKSVWQ